MKKHVHRIKATAIASGASLIASLGLAKGIAVAVEAPKAVDNTPKEPATIKVAAAKPHKRPQGLLVITRSQPKVVVPMPVAGTTSTTGYAASSSTYTSTTTSSYSAPAAAPAA